MNKLPSSSGLNLVPFIDIMLVLLCIVLSISTFIATGAIKVSLPQAENADTIASQNKDTAIVINDKGQIFVNDTAQSKDEVKSFILDMSSDTHLKLSIDRKAEFETFIFIIDILKSKKHDNFSIITQRD